MPYRRGPPRGSQNRLKHGRYTAASIAERRLVRRTIRSARLALLQALIEVSGMDAASCHRVDKST